jgi:anti-anti-sigma factor
MSFAPAPLQIISHITPDYIVMIVRGEVDLATAPQFQHELTDFLSHGPSTTLHLDLAGVSFMDSSGLHALLVGQRTAQLLGGDLILSRTSHQVERLLAITGVPFATATETPHTAASA